MTLKAIYLYLCLCISVLFLACNNNHSPSNTYQNNQQKNEKKEVSRGENSADVPSYALDVLRYIRANNEAMQGYVGGRTFQNREKQLPQQENGKKIRYQEWDVFPKQAGKNRGAERLITSKTKAYYTKNHYRSFTEIKE